MKIGTIEMTWTVGCKHCYMEFSGGPKTSYAKLAIHLWWEHSDNDFGFITLVKGLWQLWQWQPPSYEELKKAEQGDLEDDPDLGGE